MYYAYELVEFKLVFLLNGLMYFILAQTKI